MDELERQSDAGEAPGARIEEQSSLIGAHTIDNSGPHASNTTYVVIAVILGVITAVEVMVFYVEALQPVLLPILLTLSAAKFALVVMFFMHLKFDSRIFSGLFVGPLLIAATVIISMIALYGAFTGG